VRVERDQQPELGHRGQWGLPNWHWPCGLPGRSQYDRPGAKRVSVHRRPDSRHQSDGVNDLGVREQISVEGQSLQLAAITF